MYGNANMKDTDVLAKKLTWAEYFLTLLACVCKAGAMSLTYRLLKREINDIDCQRNI